ncbi:MAG: sigma-E factor negative regulatory protein [Burkholderiaceae bacterium]
MSQPENDDRCSARRLLLSALADGDASESECSQAFLAWREDEDVRATWHAYQLIGDVMRSEDLACASAANRDFLQALRTRLADEPVVLAPLAAAEDASVAQPAVANARAGSAALLRGRWQGPAAMAAGFLVVIGGFNVLRPGAHGGAADPAALALASPTASAVAPAVATAQAKADAEQLAPYLAAHRQSTMNGFFPMPAADLRNASLVQPAP